MNNSVLENLQPGNDPTKIPGYYTSKGKRKIGNINDFINTTRKLNTLPEFCKQDDQEFAGIREYFNQFMAKVRSKLQEGQGQMAKDIASQTEEINDYIMKALYPDFFATEMPSVPEYNL